MSPIYYAHPDGYLRVVGTGDLDARWQSAPFDLTYFDPDDFAAE